MCLKTGMFGFLMPSFQMITVYVMQFNFVLLIKVFVLFLQNDQAFWTFFQFKWLSPSLCFSSGSRCRNVVNKLDRKRCSNKYIDIKFQWHSYVDIEHEFQRHLWNDGERHLAMSQCRFKHVSAKKSQLKEGVQRWEVSTPQISKKC